MKKLLLLSILGIFVSVTSCKKEETPEPVVYTEPSVAAPSSIASVVAGETGTVSFSVSVDSRLTATYSATGNNVTVSNGSGSVSGTTLDINYTTSSAGAASIDLTITDSEGKSSKSTAVLNISAKSTEERITSNITENTTWTSDKVYILGGRISVTSGNTLTIEPGTIIKGEAGAGANSTALVIARGAKINAVGTASKPIIFTSVADELSIADVAAGKFSSPNLDPTVTGLWGGLIVLGKAKISVKTGTEAQIEGIPTSDTNGLYGGDDDTDNSGTLKYVSVRHGGTEIGAGNEINGITFGGVGSGTVVENIEVVANFDDGIEFFGGTVNLKNVVIYNAGDDGLDTDQAYRGTVENFAIITAGNSQFELDGPEGDYGNDLSGHTFNKGYVVVTGGSGHFIDNDANTIVNLKNIYGTGFDATSQNITEVFTNYSTTEGVTFENITLNVDAADLYKYVDKAGSNDEVPSSIKAGTAEYADLSVFDGWSWTAAAGKLK